MGGLIIENIREYEENDFELTYEFLTENELLDDDNIEKLGYLCLIIIGKINLSHKPMISFIDSCFC